jgi:hypothetical protein
MVVLHFRMNKTSTNSLHQTLAHFISPSHHSLYCLRRMSKPRLDRRARQEIEESSVLREGGVGGTIASPFAGARTHCWVDAPPSSGSTVVPYREPPPESWRAPSPWTPRPGGHIGASVSRGFVPNPLVSRLMADGGAPMCWGSFPQDATMASVAHLLPPWHPFKQLRPWRVLSAPQQTASRDLPTRRMGPSISGDDGYGD